MSVKFYLLIDGISETDTTHILTYIKKLKAEYLGVQNNGD